MSAQERDSIGLETISSIFQLEEKGSMHQLYDVYKLQFYKEDNTAYDHWMIVRDSVEDHRDSIMAQAYEVNSDFWSFEGDKLLAAGKSGYGTLCHSELEDNGAYRTSVFRCDYAVSQMATQIAYYPNGLPAYSVCCQIQYLAFDESAQFAVNKGDSIDYVEQHSSDTTFFLYDENWLYQGMRRGLQTNYLEIPPMEKADEGETAEETEKGYYINNEPVEKFVDRHIGYRPKLLLIEFYRLGVFSFNYDAASGMYFQGETHCLECVGMN